MDSFCPKFDAIVLTTNTDNKLMARLRCKQWDCEFCAKINKKMWQAHLLDTLPKISLKWSFLTITALGDDHRNKTSLQAIIKNWDKLMKRLKRSWGAFDYMRVYEQHKSGEFHAHMLISYTPPDALDKEAWASVVNPKTGKASTMYRGIAHAEMVTHCLEVGLGYIVDFKPLLDMRSMSFSENVGLTVLYVSKYLGKNLQNLPKGTRRIQTSQGIGRPKTENDEQYQWKVRSHITSNDILEHGAILDLSTKHIITTDDFLVVDHYPLTTGAMAYVNRKLAEYDLSQQISPMKREEYHQKSIF